MQYRKFSYHVYWTQYITIRYLSQYTANHLACVFTLTCTIDVLEHGTQHYAPF